MTEHTHCDHLLGSLSDYVDGELKDELCRALEQHLAGCQNCRVVVDTLRKTLYLYRQTAGEVNVSPNMRTRLFYALNLEEFLHR